MPPEPQPDLFEVTPKATTGIRVNRSILAPIAIVIFILIGLSSAPYYAGAEAEEAYQRLLAHPLPGGIMIAHRSYTRGWLSSTAENVISLRGTPIELIATHHIYHGPFPRLGQGEFSFKPVQALVVTRVSLAARGEGVDLKQILARFPELVAHTTFALDDTAETRVDLPAIQRASAETGAIDWRGLTGSIQFDNDWTRFNIQLQSPGLALNGPSGTNVTIKNLDWRLHLEESAGGLPLGGGQLTVGEFSVTDYPKLEGLAVQGNLRAAGDNVNFSLGIKIGGMQGGGQRFGAGEAALELRNIDAATLRTLQTDLESVAQKTAPSDQTRAVFAGKYSELFTGKLIELLPAFGRKSPEAEVSRLALKCTDGDLAGKAKVAVDGKNPASAQDPLLQLTATHGDAELFVPPSVLHLVLAPMIEQDLIANVGKRGGLSRNEIARLTPEARSRLIDKALPLYLPRHPLTRLLAPGDGRYKLIANLRNGELTVNGKAWGSAEPAATSKPRVPAGKLKKK